MDCGLIFHVTRIGGNFRGIWADIPGYTYRKNMKYRISICYSTGRSDIRNIFHEL